jgi:hypothetical protein
MNQATSILLIACGAVLTLSGAALVTSLPPLYSLADATAGDLLGALYLFTGAAAIGSAVVAIR